MYNEAGIWKRAPARMGRDRPPPHPLTSSHIARSSTEESAVTADAEDRKSQKYSPLSGRVAFCSFALKTYGAFGPSARRLVRAPRSRSVRGTAASRYRELGYRARFFPSFSMATFPASLRRSLTTILFDWFPQRDARAALPWWFKQLQLSLSIGQLTLADFPLVIN